MEDDDRPGIKNYLLKSLTDEDLRRLRPMLEAVDLPSGKVLYRQDEPITHIYFPESAMISVVAYSDTGQGAEVSVIGREGAAGLAVLMGFESTPYENMVQIPNGGFRMTTADARTEFERNTRFRDSILKYVQRLVVQVSQIALCNRIHSVEQRLSRWLLMSHDRYGQDSMPLTQEFIALMLGSSRPSVTMTAIELQKNGFISYERGIVTIRDRLGLETFTCSCYAVIQDAYRFSK